MEQTIRGWQGNGPRVFKRDLFGVIDIVAVAKDEFGAPYLVGIQTTSGGDHAKRMRKIHREHRAALWIRAGARLEVWSWTKRGQRNRRKLWTLRTEMVVASDIATGDPK